MQYKLWAEVVDSKKHSRLEEPPLGNIWKHSKDQTSRVKEGQGSNSTMATAFTGLANNLSKALTGKLDHHDSPKSTPGPPVDVTIISPGRRIDLQGKLLSNLHLIHSMYEKGAVTTEQFEK